MLKSEFRKRHLHVFIFLSSRLILYKMFHIYWGFADISYIVNPKVKFVSFDGHLCCYKSFLIYRLRM